MINMETKNQNIILGIIGIITKMIGLRKTFLISSSSNLMKIQGAHLVLDFQGSALGASKMVEIQRFHFPHLVSETLGIREFVTINEEIQKFTNNNASQGIIIYLGGLRWVCWNQKFYFFFSLAHHYRVYLLVLLCTA